MAIRSSLMIALALAAGCMVGSPAADDGSALDAAAPPALYGVMDSPHHAQVVTGSTPSASLEFHGFVSQPGVVVAVQLLADPDNAASWMTLASVTAATTTTSIAPGEAMYEWTTTLVPALSMPAAWPQGGLLRVRATVGDAILAVFGDDASSCLVANPSWQQRIASCAYPVQNGAIIVSAASLAPLVAEPGAARPHFLSRKGPGSATETAAYYAATKVPTTLAAFKTKYGFGGASEVAAAYYNAGDLAVGREMHCTPFAASKGTGLACASANYGAFSGPADEALSAAIAGYKSGTSEGAFAIVTTVYTPPIDAPNAVSFAVYNASGALVDTAQLDRFGDDTGIPQTCLHCHGSGATYDPSTHSANGARLTPFDPGSMQFSTEPGFTLDDMQPRLAALDAMIDQAAPAPGVDEVIAGIFAGGTYQPGFAPAGWQTGIAEASVYRNVVAESCRGCHDSYTGADPNLAFRTATELKAYAGVIAAEVCGPFNPSSPGYGMPDADAVAEHLLGGAGRAYLVDFVGATGSCVYASPQP